MRLISRIAKDKWRRLIVALLCTCQVATGTPLQAEVPFKRMERDYYGSSQQRMLAVIRSTQGWEDLVGKLKYSRYAKVPVLPSDYFRDKMIIAVFQGAQPSSGYAIKVSRIVEEGGELKVIIDETKVKAGCAAQTVVTTPCDLVETKRSDKLVVFEVREHYPEYKDLKHL